MFCRLAVLMVLAGVPGSATVTLDRIAAVVGKHVVKTSDIDRDIRLTDFINGQKLDFSPAGRKKSADRLIDQQLIRNEIQIGGYATPSDEDANKLLAQIKSQRFHSDAQYRAALQQYGISEDELRSQLLWQLEVLRFIDQRFRPAVLIGEQDVKAYYNAHLTELRKASNANTGLEALRPKIEQILQGEQINKLFIAWLDGARKSASVQYRESALQ